MSKKRTQKIINGLNSDEKSKANTTSSTCSRRKNSDDDQKELNNYEEALSRIGFGRFQYLLLLICSLRSAIDAIETLNISFLLPVAECDLNLSSSDKGYLTACLFLGMMIGGYFCGSLSDFYGRKSVMISSVSVNAIFSFLSGFSQTYKMLLILKFLGGIGYGSSIPVVWTYFAEFMPKNIRGRMLCLLSSAWVYGNLLVILIAYLVLGHEPFKWTFLSDSIVINNWRLFLIICSIPNIFCLFALSILPESPKFYLYNFDYERAQKILKYIYVFNNKIQTEHEILKKNNAFNHFEKIKLGSIVTPNEYPPSEDNQTSKKYLDIFAINMKNILKQKYLLFKAPYTLNTIISLTIRFALMFGYYGLWMWLPELVDRMSRYGGTPCHPSGLTNSQITEKTTCNIDNSVYTSSLIGCLSNLPGYIITIVYIDRIGRNIITISSLIVSGIAVLGFAFINTQTEGVILISIFGAINVLTVSSFNCTCTEIYPTTLRSTASAVQCMVGYAGSILGNLLFGLAVDITCYIPLGSISFIMILSGLLATKLPETSNIDIE